MMNKKVSGKGDNGERKSRKAIEAAATFGLILIVVGLAAPFTDLTNSDYIHFFKWIYSPGAFIFIVARIVGSADPDESMRLRRIRRLEFWAGVSFCIGVFFWFYNEDRYSQILSMSSGTMTVLRETIYFTLVGAVIQVLAVVFIGNRMKKEQRV